MTHEGELVKILVLNLYENKIMETKKSHCKKRFQEGSGLNEIKCPKCDEVFSIDETQYAEILSQVKTKEFEKELHARLEEAERLKRAEMEIAEQKATEKLRDEAAKKDVALAELKAKLDSAEVERKLAVQEALAKVEKERDSLRSQIEKSELENQVALKDAEKAKELQLAELRTRLEEAQRFNVSLSTQGIGEELEKHCREEFDKIRATAFPRAYFEKDTDVKDGTKGDFVFRDFDESGVEIISIMFEMKNESDVSASKNKNEKFYEKLDLDRKKKNCEYAVLVSSLEKESTLFNTGIVDVSHKFERMLVIRPQFFIPIITTLRNAALKSLQTKRELEAVKAQNVDISNFETSLNAFKLDAEKIYGWARDRYDEAIDAIDKAIDDLEAAKENLEKSRKHLGSANKRAQELTIRTFTKNNPTMEQKFKELGN